MPPASATPAASAGRGGGGGLILPAVIIVALAVIGILLWSQRDGTRPIAGTDNPQAVAAGTDVTDTTSPAAGTAPAPSGPATSATILDSAFHSDPQSARARYAGFIVVTGIIAAPPSLSGTPSLSLEGRTPFNYVLANFPDGYGAQLTSAAKGSRVTLSCRSVGTLAGTTILQGCSL